MAETTHAPARRPLRVALSAVAVAVALALGGSPAGPVAAAEPAAAKPKVAVVAAKAMRLHSLGIDRWDVWVCGIPPDTTSGDFGGASPRRVRITPRVAARGLQQQIAPYFRYLSEGRYRQRFRARGTVELGRRQGLGPCERRAKRASAGRDGAVIVTNLPIGGPTWAGADWCGDEPRPRPPGRTCDGKPHTLPGNERLVRIPAGTLVDALPTGAQLGTAAHEMGHAMAWPHAFTGRLFAPHEEDGETIEIGIPYDDPLDVMGYERLWGTGSWQSWRSGDYRLKGTQIFNRLAAGWVPRAAIAVHRRSEQTYRIAPIGSRGKQLLVVESGHQRAFLTLEARVRRSYDRTLPAAGINVHAIDQRSSACSFAEKLRACWGEGRRQMPIPNDPDSLASLIRPGKKVDTAGITIHNLGPAKRGGFRVRVSGRRATLPPIQPEACMLLPGSC